MPDFFVIYMDISTRYGQYWDQQAVAQYSILNRLNDVPMLTFAEWWLMDRLAALQSGRIAARDHTSVERKICEVDSDLRLRYDFEHAMFAVDKFVREWGYYFTLFFWSHRLGDGTALREILRESDMQRPEYMRDKKIAQELVLQRNAKLRTEMALAAVDQLSEASIRNFIAVERAMQVGEKVDVRGQDAEIMNRMYEATKRRDAEAAKMEADMRAQGQDVVVVPEPTSACINSGMHPFKFQRDKERYQ